MIALIPNPDPLRDANAWINDSFVYTILILGALLLVFRLTLMVIRKFRRRSK